MRTTTAHPVLIIEALRPNGRLLDAVSIPAAKSLTVNAALGDLRRQVRDKRGWTPTFRVLHVVDGVAHDVTDLYEV